MEKHTKGPWEGQDAYGKWLADSPWTADNYDAPRTEYVPVHKGKKVIAVVVADEWDSGYLAANARLISAAPDLLEALKYARRMVKSSDCDTAFIDAAIAKATGGE
jgi:hypothetical protein